MKRFLILLTVEAGIAAAGCTVRNVSVDWDDSPRHGGVVYVERGHVCTRLCDDHYWNGSRTVVLRGHHHHPGCGHVFRNGHWILAASVGSRHVHLGASHVCGPNCRDHYWNGSKYVILRGHRHGPGCGHVLVHNRWVLAKSSSHKTRVVRPGKTRVIRGHKSSTSSKHRIKGKASVKGKAKSGRLRGQKIKSKKSRSRSERP